MPDTNLANRKFRHPILGALGWFLIAYLLVNFCAIGALIIEPENEARQMLWVYGLGAFGGVYSLFFFYMIYRSEKLQNFATCGSFRLGALLIIPGLLYAMTGIPVITTAPTLQSTLLSLNAGVAEEVMFRALPIAYMMRAYKFEEKKIPLVVITTGAFFGLFHMTNMIAGASFAVSVYQAIYCIAIGILFGAVYIRSGNIIWCIISHFTQDFIAMLNEEAVQSDGIMNDIAFDLEFLISLSVAAVLAVIGLIYIRKSKRGEISKRWKTIWAYKENMPEAGDSDAAEPAAESSAISHTI